MQHMLSIALSSSFFFVILLKCTLFFTFCSAVFLLSLMLFVCGGRKCSFVISNSEGRVVRAQFWETSGRVWMLEGSNVLERGVWKPDVKSVL